MFYRAYLKDKFDRCAGSLDLVAASSLAAFEYARSLQGEKRVELWQDDRFLGRLEPAAPPMRPKLSLVR